MARDEKAGAFSPTATSSPLADEYYHGEPTQQSGYRDDQDVFGDEAHHGIHYRTLTWPFVVWQHQSLYDHVTT